MDNLNRTISFILGLVVVIVFLAFITGRLNLKSRLPILGGPTVTSTAKVTPTVTPPLTISPSASPTNSVYHPYPTSIPSTGSPTLLLPILLSGLTTGIFLIRKTK